MNLLAKIETDFNQVSAQIHTAPPELRPQLVEKKKNLERLAYDYVNLEGRYKEIAGL